MPKYDVHIYAIVRVKVAGVEASSPAEAASHAESNTDLYTGFKDGEYVDQIDGFLVDTLNAAGKIIAETSLDAKYRPNREG